MNSVKIRRASIIGLCAASALLLSMRSYGLTWMGANLEYAVRQAAFHIGPFHIRMVLALSNAGYDSNVYRTAENPVRDYSVTAGPAFYLYVPIKNRVVFSVYESPQYVYFFQTARERTWNNFLNGRVNFSLNRFFLMAGAGISVAREIWNTEIDIRPQRKERSVESEALWQATKKLSFLVSFHGHRFDYQDLALSGVDLRDALNRTEMYLSGSILRQLTGRVRGGIEGELGRYEFQKAGSPSDSESRGLYGRLDLEPAGNISGRVRIGWKDFRLTNVAGGGYKGLAGSTEITIRLGQRVRLRGSYASDVQFSAWRGYAFYLEKRAGAGIAYYPFRNIRIDYGYYQGKNSYPNTALTGEGVSEPRADEYRNHQVGLYYRLKERIALGVVVNWWQRESTLAFLNGKEVLYGANIIYDF